MPRRTKTSVPANGKAPTPDLAFSLLAWFDVNRRDLPWRDAPCGRRDPYRVWLAEIMLQQTTVQAVIPYYQAFLERWPDVKALAEADDDQVLARWAGLGYYARARNMLKCARAVADTRQGAFPRAVPDLLELPGIGDYTAQAVAAIAFNADVLPVDGNVIRVLSRLLTIDAPMPAGKALIAEAVDALLPQGRAGDFAEALMDLGARVCRPKNPDCAACPWGSDCRARAEGAADAYPKKAAKKPRPTRYGWAFWIERADGSVLLEKRPPKGLFGGMVGFPTTDWDAAPLSAEDAARALVAGGGKALSWQPVDGRVEHTFTHFHLILQVMRVKPGPGTDGLWCAPGDLAEIGLPTLMKKVSRLVLPPSVSNL